MHSFQLSLSPAVLHPVRVSQASLVLADYAASRGDDLQCGFICHLLGNIQRCLPALQPSQQPLLDYGETAQRPCLLSTVPYYPGHRSLTKV